MNYNSTLSSAACTVASLSVSSAEVASSSSRILGSRTRARAMAMRCFCPPLSCAPRSPTNVSYFYIQYLPETHFTIKLCIVLHFSSLSVFNCAFHRTSLCCCTHCMNGRTWRPRIGYALWHPRNYCDIIIIIVICIYVLSHLNCYWYALYKFIHQQVVREAATICPRALQVDL